MKALVESWGRFPKAVHSTISTYWRHEPLPNVAATLLPYGLGRSYGDSCLNCGQTLIATRGLNRFMEFDSETGRLICESGVTIGEILEFAVPRGWFVPVTPGTKHVTVGGAIANDVHGKNHHVAGTFGNHVTRFELLRSTGERIACSKTENADWFRATVGGLGLTGLITWAEIMLKPIRNRLFRVESIKFHSLDEFLALSAESSPKYEYTVAWIDSAINGSLVRGIFQRGNHDYEAALTRNAPTPRDLKMRFDLPDFTLNRWTIRFINQFYYYRPRAERASTLCDYETFLYPLDRITDWNRIYGRRGFLQYQCLTPEPAAGGTLMRILSEARGSGQASCLGVLKVMGSWPSTGILSFAGQGITLAIDFPNTGQPVLTLLERLDAIIREAGGRVYPAKDARMTAASFGCFYPHWRELLPYIDPNFSSSFWRRVTA